MTLPEVPKPDMGRNETTASGILERKRAYIENARQEIAQSGDSRIDWPIGHSYLSRTLRHDTLDNKGKV